MGPDLSMEDHDKPCAFDEASDFFQGLPVLCLAGLADAAAVESEALMASDATDTVPCGVLLPVIFSWICCSVTVDFSGAADGFELTTLLNGFVKGAVLVFLICGVSDFCSARDGLASLLMERNG